MVAQQASPPFFLLQNIWWINPSISVMPKQGQTVQTLINRLHNTKCKARLAYTYFDTETGTNNLNGWSSPTLEWKRLK